MRMEHARFGGAQLPPIAREPSEEGDRTGSEIEVEVPMRDEDLSDGVLVGGLILEPEFGVEAVLIEMGHHRHDEFKCAYGEVDAMNDNGHDGDLGLSEIALPAILET